MKDYNTIVFRLDGTVIDTSQDIIACYNHAARELNISEKKPESLKNAIGLSVTTGFLCYYGIGERKAKEAALAYRRSYRRIRVFRAKLYDGIVSLLSWLKKNGYKTAATSMWPEECAAKTLRDCEIARYFDVITGFAGGAQPSGAQMINSCIERLKTGKGSAVMIGNSVYDGKSATEAGVDFIGATYGLGLAPSVDVRRNKSVLIADRPENIIRFLDANR